MSFQSIMVPVDLHHVETLEKALKTAADIAKLYDAQIALVAITGSAPTDVAGSPESFQDQLQSLADRMSAQHGVTFHARTVVSPDPSVDLDEALQKTASDLSVDLVVMASHVPGFWEHIFASHGGYLASHATISVLVVR